jgi:outer membrane protein assembly factor BamB
MRASFLMSRRARRKGGAFIGLMMAAAVGSAALGGLAAADARNSLARSPATPPATDWPAYLNGPLHNSYSPAEKAITPANSAHLAQKWHFGPSVTFYASPTVADGAVYVGSDAGWFYKLSERTGRVLAKRFIGVQPAISCFALGVVSTATVAPDPANGRLTVYVAGPDGYLYALKASNLAVEWKSVVGGIPSRRVNNYFNYSSPTVANGKIYMGVSSNCDMPLVRGAVVAYNQVTGRQIARFYTVPRGDVGGSVWSSIAVAPNGDVFASTGNGPPSDQLLGYSESIIKLSPDRLKQLGRFQIPLSQVAFDSDFGASPLVFGNYVGACDKNGVFYLLNRTSMKVRWERQIATPPNSAAECVATPAYDGKYLYFGANTIKIKGVTYPGSIQKRLASSGRLVWERGLPNGVTGSPALDGAGVLAVGEWDLTGSANDTILVRASSGAMLTTLLQDMDFSQSVFAGNWLFAANDNGVYAFAPR